MLPLLSPEVIIAMTRPENTSGVFEKAADKELPLSISFLTSPIIKTSFLFCVCSSIDARASYIGIPAVIIAESCLKQKLEELNRTGQPIRYEKEYIRKDGSRVPIELLVSITLDMEGNPEYYYSFFTNITERKQSEDLLKENE